MIDTTRIRLCISALSVFLFASLLMTAHAIRANEKSTGVQIFRKRCASCHGVKGEGSKSYQKALAGDKSLGQLASFISKSMPPGPVRKCTGEDARQVAVFIYEAFYSPLAQARNKPARIEVSRLTVRQFRNAVTDLVGSFRSPASLDDKRGLRGEYFKTGRLRGGNRVLERVDSEIKFDFGTSGALPEQDDPYQFSMRWQGSVLAPDTGDYEFIVHTEHAARLWVNDLKKPVIDAYVKSGSDDEYRASIYLLGGRAYPIRLEFGKGVQGVDDLSKIKKKPPAKASIAFQWRSPKRSIEVIPQRCLVPITSPEAFAVQAPFPPDDRSIGYERGTSISKAWDEATTEAAIETAGYVASHLQDLSGVADGATDREQRLREFCKQFVERAFRRPVTSDLEQFYVSRQFKGAADKETAVKRVVLLTLKSPRFLYREIGLGKPDSYDVASRLSFGLWDSIPDQELMKAAAAGELATRDQVARQAERMVADPRAWSKLREFFLQWLKVENFPELSKDPKRFPGFDQSVASDLRTSLELSLEQTVWSGKSDYRELWLSNVLFLNGRLAKLYGVDLPVEAPFQSVPLDSSERAGVLTHPYLMSVFAYRETSSPIHRGVLLARNLIGRTLRPPPQAFTPIPATLHPNLTTRQRVALQTQSANCMSCHGMINPLGFTLEKFDAIGRLQAQENGRTIDNTGSYQTLSGRTVKFSGVHDLAEFLAVSEEAHGAFVEKLFHHLVKQPVRAYGPQTQSSLQKSFAANEYSIKKLMVEIMAETVLKH